jgi:hypothetical protein
MKQNTELKETISKVEKKKNEYYNDLTAARK